MESPDTTTTQVGGPYPEEILLEAYNLEWESIELRRQRLKKTWQQFVLMEKIEQEERHYQRQLQRIKQQEKQAREQAEREQAENQRRQGEKEADLLREKERAEVEKKKKVNQVTVSGTQTDEEPVQTKKKETKTVKAKRVKSKTQSKQGQETKPIMPKRITPVSLPSAQPEDDESVSENQIEPGGYDSPPPVLPDDDLLNMLSLDKDSDSDGDEPSMVSLIHPVSQESPKQVQPTPLKKKKRYVRKNEGPSLDFNFSNAEARRQAKAAAQEQEDSEEVDSEPEPMPTPTPKKHLNRRKKANGVGASGGKSLMTHMASTTIAVKPKKSATNSATEAGDNAVRKRIVVNNTSKDPQIKTKAKPKNAQTFPENEEDSIAPPTKKKVSGKSETMSIKQRLANAELLAKMNKMQDVSTPKVLDKKTKKAQNQGAAKILTAKRAEFRKVLASDTTEPDVSQRDQMIDEGDLNISLNSSGLISDNDSPKNLRVPTRKRPREAAGGDVTPTKKLQFLEITKRLVKSPMPRFLRTPTPLMSPGVPSGSTKPKTSSPAPRVVSARSTASTRRLNSAPVRPKKTNANRFGVPAGGTSTAANGGGFSMFDAFVNSGSSGAIPRLKTSTRGDVSPSVYYKR